MHALNKVYDAQVYYQCSFNNTKINLTKTNKKQ